MPYPCLPFSLSEAFELSLGIPTLHKTLELIFHVLQDTLSHDSIFLKRKIDTVVNT